MKTKIRSVTMGFCLTVLILFGVTAVARVLTQNVFVDALGMNNSITNFILTGAADSAATYELQTIDIDWAELYPFEGVMKAETEEQPTEEPSELRTIAEAAANIPAAAMSKIQALAEAYTTSNLVFRVQLVEAQQFWEDTVGWNLSPLEEYNSTIDLGDGYLAAYMTEQDMSANIKAIADFGEFCNQSDIPLLYVQAPGKISKYEDTVLVDKLDFSNQRADDLLAGLEAEGINTLDLRACIAEDGLSHRELFFYTDHHWKPETALWATAKIAGKLNQNYGFDLDLSLLEESRYDKQVYEDWFLGSQGKKVTLAKCEPDDISLFYPKFETNLSVLMPDIGLDIQGDFSVLYNMEQVEVIDYMGLSPYHAYVYGDRPLIQIENSSCQNGQRCLIIHDSFGDTMIPFLSMEFTYCDAIDLRHFTGSLGAYIKETKPNMILVLYNVGVLGEVDTESNTNLFNFH